MHVRAATLSHHAERVQTAALDGRQVHEREPVEVSEQVGYLHPVEHGVAVGVDVRRRVNEMSVSRRALPSSGVSWAD